MALAILDLIIKSSIQLPGHEADSGHPDIMSSNADSPPNLNHTIYLYQNHIKCVSAISIHNHIPIRKSFTFLIHNLWNLLNPINLRICHPSNCFCCGACSSCRPLCQDLTSTERWDWEELEDAVGTVGSRVQHLDLVLADAWAVRDGMLGLNCVEFVGR